MSSWSCCNEISWIPTPPRRGVFSFLGFIQHVITIFAIHYNHLSVCYNYLQPYRLMVCCMMTTGAWETWRVCLRNDLSTGDNTINFVECSANVVKEKILHRMKAYSATQLVDVVATRMAYYIGCLTDIANNRRAGVSRLKCVLHESDVECGKIAPVWSMCCIFVL